MRPSASWWRGKVRGGNLLAVLDTLYQPGSLPPSSGPQREITGKVGETKKGKRRGGGDQHISTRKVNDVGSFCYFEVRKRNFRCFYKRGIYSEKNPEGEGAA